MKKTNFPPLIAYGIPQVLLRLIRKGTRLRDFLFSSTYHLAETKVLKSPKTHQLSPRLFSALRLVQNSVSYIPNTISMAIKFMRLIHLCLARPTGQFLVIPFIRYGFLALSLIILLFLPGSPATILLAIMSVIVYAVYCGICHSELLGMFLKRGVHIFSELPKIFPETLNPTTPIVLKILRFWVITADKYFTESKVKLRSIHSVFRGGFSESISSRTTTRSRMSTFKVIAYYFRKIATIALAFPNKFILNWQMPSRKICAIISKKIKHSKFPKLQTSKYFNSSHIKSISKSRGRVNVNCGDNLKHQYA